MEGAEHLVLNSVSIHIDTRNGHHWRANVVNTLVKVSIGRASVSIRHDSVSIDHDRVSIGRDSVSICHDLVFKAHRLLYHSTLGLRVIKKKKTIVCTGRVGRTNHKRNSSTSFDSSRSFAREGNSSGSFSREFLKIFRTNHKRNSWTPFDPPHHQTIPQHWTHISNS